MCIKALVAYKCDKNSSVTKPVFDYRENNLISNLKAGNQGVFSG